MSDPMLSRMTSSHAQHGVSRLVARLASVRGRMRERAEASHLSERDLRDLGVSRATLAYELNKPLWRG